MSNERLAEHWTILNSRGLPRHVDRLLLIDALDGEDAVEAVRVGQAVIACSSSAMNEVAQNDSRDYLEICSLQSMKTVGAGQAGCLLSTDRSAQSSPARRAGVVP